MTPHPTGAIPQRDQKTFGMVTRIPAGVVTPDMLETIAAAARKYRVPLVKLTSGQRFMLIGIPGEDIPLISNDLGMMAGKKTAPCVRLLIGVIKKMMRNFILR